jgi:hypothetical protein
MNLDENTRKTTLKLVDEIMQEDDWMLKMRDYKEYLKGIRYSDMDAHLKYLYDDLNEAIHGHLRIHKEENDEAGDRLEIK